MITLNSNFIFNFTNFCVMVSFLTKLLILGILFLTSFVLALRAVVVANIVLLDISLLNLFILVLSALNTKINKPGKDISSITTLAAQLVISGILCERFLILALLHLL